LRLGAFSVEKPLNRKDMGTYHNTAYTASYEL
jgi:hypothetical protein